MNRRIVSSLGARSQFVKASVVSLALRGPGAQEILENTRQHYGAGNCSDRIAKIIINSFLNTPISNNNI